MIDLSDHLNAAGYVLERDAIAEIAAEQLTMADRIYCRLVAEEFAALQLNESARAWDSLGDRIERHVFLQPSLFAWLDVQLVAALHVQVEKDRGAENYEARRRNLARIGMLVTRQWLTQPIKDAKGTR